MKRRRLVGCAVVALVLVTGRRVVAGGESGGFVSGHLFVTMSEPEGCDFGYEEWIVEIDPATGEWSVFADLDDGICYPSGLRFSPDGQRLLVVNAGHLLPFTDGWVQAFDADGSNTVILDESDGLGRPYGANAVAFDGHGNLYIVDTGYDAILRFPADGGPPTIFADAADGIHDRGALDFAPNGDLFYAGDLAGAIIRITPEGEASVFDTPPTAPDTLAIDRAGNLFVGAGSGVYRYENGDPASRRVLVSGFFGAPALGVALSPDEHDLYVAEPMTGLVYTVDPQDGTTTLLADLSDLSWWWVFPTGMTVHTALVPGDMDGDGDGDLDDFGAFEFCLTGPVRGALPPECAAADLDHDHDVDLDDFGVFQRSFTGAN